MKSRILKFLVVSIFAGAAITLQSLSVSAVPANPCWQNAVQPDGEKFSVRLHGDEHFSWIESETGDVVDKGDDGYWYVDEIRNNKLMMSTSRYSKKGVLKNSIKSNDMMKMKDSLNSTDSTTGSSESTDSTSSTYSAASDVANAENITLAQQQGADATVMTNSVLPTSATFSTHPSARVNRKALIVLVSFSDKSLTYTDDQQWSNMFFGTDGSTVRNFYDEESNGSFIFGPVSETYGNSNDGVVKVLLDDKTHPGVRGKTNDQINSAFDAMLPEVMSKLDPYVDFAGCDTNGDGKISPQELCIAVVLAGNELASSSTYPGIWGHEYCSSLKQTTYDGVTFDSHDFSNEGEIQSGNMLTIGEICHELAHCFGAIDLYNNWSTTVSDFSLMSSGCWRCLQGELLGQTPTHLDPYNNVLTGILYPVTGNRAGTCVVKSSALSKNIIRINTTDPKIYYLIENRQLEGFDTPLATSCNYGGIAVWKINQHSGDNSGGRDSWLVDMKQADNGLNLVGNYKNPFYAADQGRTQLGADTAPNTRLPDGTDSQVGITTLSNSGDSMDIQVSAPEVYVDTQNKGPVIQSFMASTSTIKSSSEAVCLKAVVKENSASISAVTFSIGVSNAPVSPLSFQGICTSTSQGFKTYEASYVPMDYSDSSSIFFNVKATDSNGNISSWNGVKPSVTVDTSAANANLSLGKSVTASSQLSGQPSENAVNGSLADGWSTADGNNSWLRVDLGSVMTVNRWKVIHESGSGSGNTGTFTRSFRLQISDDGVNNWRDIDWVDNWAGLGVTDRPVQPFKSRYVRLFINSADSDNYARIHEFQLYNDPITGVEASFDTQNPTQTNGDARYLGTPHYTDSVAYSKNVSGYYQGTSPECTLRTGECSHNGQSSLLVEGSDNSAVVSYCYYTVYDNLNTKVSADTVLSYWTCPQNDSGRYIGVDIEFTDGRCLRDNYNVVDQNGIAIHPNSGHGTVGQWSLVKANIGAYAGCVIKRILIAYDNYDGTGQYKGYIDDIAIREEDQNAKGIIADFDGSLSNESRQQKPLGTANYVDSCFNKMLVSGCDGASAPVCRPKTNEQTYSGDTSLYVAGTANGNSSYYACFAYFTVYDNVNYTVNPKTNLSYWIFPQTDNARHIGVDIEFTDGTSLRNSRAVDQNGVWLHPDGNTGPGGRGNLNQWNFITSNIGHWVSGKTIKKITIGYDRPRTSGIFKAYIDNIDIEN